MTLETMTRANVQFFSNSSLMEHAKDDTDGQLVLSGVKVFKAGTFKDSWGEQHTWSDFHLNQMVANFSVLSDVFPNVPVRDGHPGLFGSGGDVVGYFQGLNTDGEFLYGDLQILDPQAQEKVRSGLFRARSLEVGFYETNDEALFWPVVMGVAFVDIPAVEGLYNKSKSDQNKGMTLLVEKEFPVGKNGSQHSAAEGGEGTPPAATPPAPGQAQQGATQDDQGGQAAAQQGEGTEGTESQAEGGTPAAAPQTESTDHGRGNGQPFVFSIGGQQTTDFAAVQRHITAMETAQREQAEQARRDYVASLVRDNKILATQQQAFENHAVSLTDEQYEAFRALHEGAPSAPLLGMHGGGTSNHNGATGTEGTDPKAERIKTLEEIVANHRRAKMPHDKLIKTESYQELQTLLAEQN